VIAPDDLAGRAAFVTGGAQGIGLGIARALARRGVKVALADIDGARLADARAELGAVTDVATFVLDVRDRDRFASVADDAEAALGPVTLLFNNAGVIGSTSPTRMTYAAWDWVLGINLHGVVNGIQTFVPRMIERGAGGHVVNTSSGAGVVEGGSGFLYTTSKFAVVGMSESLHRELAHHHIGVSVLCPGAVATEIITNTAATRPAGQEPTPRVAAILAAAQESLAAATPPDDVGEMVIDAITTESLYVFTDASMEEPIRQRTERLLAALPTATRR
jgi:NAD(P)-dependent dehydrogenase (short-subunit alcohol dehydrogenase family)